MTKEKTYIIAEAGVNHNGDKELGLQLIAAAAAAGADAVKFQTFKAENLVTKTAGMAEYQKKNLNEDSSQYGMLKKLELPFAFYRNLKEYADELNIDFMSTAFDREGLQLLAGDLDVSRLKIPSGDLTNLPFLLEHAWTGKPIILSTGMGTIEEIKMALDTISFGYLKPHQTPQDYQQIEGFRFSDEARKLLLSRVQVLHCTTEYPAPFETVNLYAIDLLRDEFSLPIGYSDHTEGIAVPVAAVARGAVVIEKHFTLDKSLPGPDHKASIDPVELTQMVKDIRVVDLALGERKKTASPVELENRKIVRRSLVASSDISAGDSLTDQNICLKRPGTGMPPLKLWELDGQQASRSYREGDLLDE